MCDPAHESRLIDEYCGDKALLRKLEEEHARCLREMRAANKLAANSELLVAKDCN